jgi:hypothetical protein
MVVVESRWSECSGNACYRVLAPFQLLKIDKSMLKEEWQGNQGFALEIKPSYLCLYINVSWRILTIYGEAIWRK